MYQLYYNKENCELKLKPIQAAFKNLPITDEVWHYNGCYYLCSNRKLLKEKALELKEEWLQNAQNRIDSVLAIKI